jgi:light-harvesting complex 1 beta chain
MSQNNGSMSEEDAKAFHGYFIMMMGVFVATAVAAHLLVWSWRPWF